MYVLRHSILELFQNYDWNLIFKRRDTALIFIRLTTPTLKEKHTTEASYKTASSSLEVLQEEITFTRWLLSVLVLT